jgi:hypothetical protein
MLNPAFHFQNLNGFLDIFNDLSLDCAAKIERIILATASSGCQEIDVHSIMSLLVFASGVKLYFNLEQIARIDFFNELYYYQDNKYFFKTPRRNNYIYY